MEALERTQLSCVPSGFPYLHAGQVTPDLYPLFIQVRPHLSDPIIRNWGRWGAGACNVSTEPPAKKPSPMFSSRKTPHVIYIPGIPTDLSTNSAMENRCVCSDRPSSLLLHLSLTVLPIMLQSHTGEGGGGCFSLRANRNIEIQTWKSKWKPSSLEQARGEGTATPTLLM